MTDSDRFAEKLAPEAIHAALVRAALFLAGWELLKSEVVDKVKNFFVEDFDENGVTVSSAYERVLNRHKSRFEASLIWLEETGALDQKQSGQIRAIREHRNEVAHELPSLLIDPTRTLNTDLLTQMNTLLGVLGRFWGTIEVETDPQFEGRDVAYERIQSGSMLLMEHLVSIVSATTSIREAD